MYRIRVHMCFDFFLTSAVCPPPASRAWVLRYRHPYRSCTCLKWCSGAAFSQGPSGKSGSGPHSCLPHSPGSAAALDSPWSVTGVCPVASGDAA